MIKKISNDINFGLQKKIELLVTLKNYFKDDTIDRLDENNKLDYVGNNKFIELK